MTLDELNAKIQTENNDIDLRKNALRKLCRERDSLAAIMEIQNLSPAARDLLLKPRAIESEETVGIPGK